MEGTRKSSANDDVAYNLRSRRVTVDPSRSKKSRKLDGRGKKPVEQIRPADIENQLPSPKLKEGGSKPSLSGEDRENMNMNMASKESPRLTVPQYQYVSHAAMMKLFRENVNKPMEGEELRYMAIYGAKKALEQYNSNKHVNFKFKELKAAKGSAHAPRVTVHMNFIAESDDDDDDGDGASPKLFYVDMIAPFYDIFARRQYELEVKCCCVLEKLDSGIDPKSGYCDLCSDIVDHPSPRYGYRCANGDDC